MRTTTWLGAAAGAAALTGLTALGAAQAASVVPEKVDGNPTCESQGYAHGIKFDDDPRGTLTRTVDGLGTVTLMVQEDGQHWDWESDFGIDAVISKGGDAANVYRYDPPAESFGDTGMVSPLNDGGQVPGLSHANFCFDYDVTVSKTATTSYTRTHDWSITKVGSEDSLRLSSGQTFVVDYDVTVAQTPVDSDWAVEGEITVTNPDPTYAATVESVSDVVSPDLAATSDCGVSLPYALAPGGTLTCAYGPLSLPDGSDRTNTATVTTSGKVGDGSGSAAVTFGDPTTVVDECVAVTDDRAGTLGTVCAADAPSTFEYSLDVVGETCGESELVNTATFVAKDTGATGSDSHAVAVTVECAVGCSLTQGYWKTHSEHGPAPYDDTWALLPDGADTPFFLSGQSHHQVLWTPPAGNAYYTLAHQYIAARLNALNGADTSVITGDLAAAEALLGGRTPAQVATLKGKDRGAWVDLADRLDTYNNGLIGPGHCDE